MKKIKLIAMWVQNRDGYTLLLSTDPCEVFYYFNVKEMHGLNLKDCELHQNTKQSSYIAGWCNFIPKENKEYCETDKRFVFINLSRCTDSVKTTGLIMHELCHQALFRFNYDAEKEEEIITWAENETYEIYKYVNTLI